MVDLFVKVQTQVIILNRLHVVCDLLRKIMRTQNLTIQALNKDSTLSPNAILEISKIKLFYTSFLFFLIIYVLFFLRPISNLRNNY